nr:clp protease proteolytic subunit [Plantago ovata]
MPVGIPQLPFLVPDDNDDDDDDDGFWVDMNRLYRARFLFLSQEVQTEISNQLCALIVHLGLEDKTEPIYLYVHSPGGLVIPGLALYNIMQSSKPGVHTIGIARAYSTGSLILAGGKMLKRLALPHCTVMVHQPASSYFEDPLAESGLDAEDMVELRNLVIQAYIAKTGKPYWVIADDLERDQLMTPEEARAYGIVDVVGYDKP